MTLLSITALALSLATLDRTLLDEAKKHYRSLDSFSMSIEHQDSSGLFPGTYKQELKWMKGGRFQLIVTKSSDYKPTEGKPGGVAPNYYCDGKSVMSIHPDGSRTSRSAGREPNTTPGWEVSGGVIISWLMNGTTAEFLEKPPQGFNLEFAAGPMKTWNDLNVRELVLTMSGQDRKVDLHLYFAASSPELLGMQWTNNNQVSIAKYLNQQRNPKLPETLGNPPSE